MTIEKALDMLRMIEFKDTEAHLHTWYKGIDDDMNEAVRMAIEIIEAEPSTDCISRQAVLDYIYNDLRLGDVEIGNDVERQMELESSYEYVKSLPSVNPQPKTGHWIKIKPYPLQMHDYECSECLHETDDPTENYCSECGAKMVEPQERSGEV